MVEKGSEKISDEEVIRKFGLVAEQLVQWDRRIVQILVIKELSGQKEEKLDLICTFDPEPPSDITGFFLIANLLTRMEFEALDEQLGISQPIDMGFKIGQKVFLPNGKILSTLGDHIVLWPNHAE